MLRLSGHHSIDPVDMCYIGNPAVFAKILSTGIQSKENGTSHCDWWAVLTN